MVRSIPADMESIVQDQGVHQVSLECRKQLRRIIIIIIIIIISIASVVAVLLIELVHLALQNLGKDSFAARQRLFAAPNQA